MDYSALFLTFKLALITTMLLMIFSAPIAYFLAFTTFPGKSYLEALIYLPTALPPTVIGFYLIMVLGPKGIVGKGWETLTRGSLLFTFTGLVIASVIYSVPYAVQPIKASFQKLDRRLLENASILGLSRKAAFFRVVLPNSITGIVAAGVLVFLHCIGAFGVIVMVGGSIPGETRVASIAIFEAVESMDYYKAGMLSLTFITISYIFLIIINKFYKDSSNVY